MIKTGLHATEELEAGTRLEAQTSYRLVRPLGAGGMGDVWLAERLSLGGHSQLVALKVLVQQHEGGALAPEALRMSRLTHVNIVPFVDSGRLPDGRHFIAMVHVDGPNLDDLRRFSGPTAEDSWADTASRRLPDRLVGYILQMVLRALRHAHTFDFGEGPVGVVHRDVSPGNILISEVDGIVKLTDFGLAARPGLAGGQAIAGKVPYLAPEHFDDRPLDARTDLYALGVVTYELLTGFNPNLGPADLETPIGAVTRAMLAMERPLIPADEVVQGVEPHMSTLVTRMLATDPADRPQSADEAIDELCGYRCPSSGSGATECTMVEFLKLRRLARDGGSLGDVDKQCTVLQNLEGDLTGQTRTLTERAMEALVAGHHPCREPEGGR